MPKLVTLIPLALAAVLLAGCGGGGGAASALDASDIAVVGSTHVTKAQFDALLAQAKRNYRTQGRPFPKQGTTEFEALKGQAVALLVQQAERIDKAHSMGIQPSNAEVDTRLKQIKKTFFHGSEKRYFAALKKEHLTDAQVREDVLYTLLSEDVSKKLDASVSVSDSEVQQYYNAHKLNYTAKPSRDVRYILVKSKATANTVYRELKHGNVKTWCRLAKRYAKDASGQNCGKATFAQGETVAVFDRTAFSAPANEVHVPFYDPTRYKSWFVIEPLGGVKPGSTTPEKDVASSIRTTLLRQKQQQAMSDWLAGLKDTFCSGSKIRYQVGYSANPDPCTATTTAATTG
jgi:peptidyl-prolyl cis-trans isomerase C